jgi:hypothetical protein
MKTHRELQHNANKANNAAKKALPIKSKRRKEAPLPLGRRKTDKHRVHI